MRRLPVWVIAVAVLIVTLAVLVATRDDPAPATAQDATRPLLFNEVADWCGAGTSACDGASYADLADGSLRVVLNLGQGHLGGSCTDDLTIPEGVEGWAYVEDSGSPIATVPAGLSAEEMEGSVVAEMTAGDDTGRVVPIAEVRGLASVQVCELVVRRAG